MKTKDWSKTSIDKFVLRKLESKGMAAPKDAEPHTILRRLFLDLNGLPPTPQQVSTFKSRYKKSPDKTIRSVVDYLLKQDAYGERWGRHCTAPEWRPGRNRKQ